MWSPDKAVKGHSCEHDQRTLQAKRGSYTGFAMMHVVHVRSDQVELVTSTHRPDRQDIWRLSLGAMWQLLAVAHPGSFDWFGPSDLIAVAVLVVVVQRRWQSCNAYRYVLPGHACGRMNSRGFHAPTARPILHRWEIKRGTHSLFASKLHFANGMRTIAARDYKFYQTLGKLVQKCRHIMIMCIQCVWTYLQCIEIHVYITIYI